MHKIDRQSQTPMYQQLADLIRGRIEDGVLGYGNRIASENALVEEYGVSRITVRKALDLLVDENYLFRKQGKGTFVSLRNVSSNRAVEQGFTAESFRDGAIPSTQVIGKTIIPAEQCPAEGRANFTGAELLLVACVRYVDGVPVIYEQDYFPMRFAELLDIRMDNRSVFSLLGDRFGVCFSGYSYVFTVAEASPEHAKVLGVPARHPLLRVCQTVRGGNDQFVFFNTQMVRTDIYKYRTSMTIEP
ncbi:MAG TPA: GntR family transcriptional regulator [Clostridia bacterium]|nr:GntR family transcriptional regulator [Clostridia bacterium]